MKKTLTLIFATIFALTLSSCSEEAITSEKIEDTSETFEIETVDNSKYEHMLEELRNLGVDVDSDVEIKACSIPDGMHITSIQELLSLE